MTTRPIFLLGTTGEVCVAGVEPGMELSRDEALVIALVGIFDEMRKLNGYVEAEIAKGERLPEPEGQAGP